MTERWGKVPLWWLRTLRGYPNALIVASCLAAYADADGAAWPTADTIAEETGIRRDRVFAAIARLKEAGIITNSESQHKRGTRHYLRFTVPLSSTASTGDPDAAVTAAVPASSTAASGECGVAARPAVPLSGTPANRACSTDERVAAVPLARSAIRSGTDQEQRSDARACVNGASDHKQPAYEFCHWMLDEGIKAGAIPPHHALDPLKWCYPQLDEAEKLIATYGAEEGRARAARFAKASAARRIKYKFSVANLLEVWRWDEVSGTHPAAAGAHAKASRTLRVVTREMLEAAE